MAGALEGRSRLSSAAPAGWGRSTVLRFLKESAKVVVGDLNEKNGVGLVAEIGTPDRLRWCLPTWRRTLASQYRSTTTSTGPGSARCPPTGGTTASPRGRPWTEPPGSGGAARAMNDAITESKQQRGPASMRTTRTPSRCLRRQGASRIMPVVDAGGSTCTTGSPPPPVDTDARCRQATPHHDASSHGPSTARPTALRPDACSPMGTGRTAGNVGQGRASRSSKCVHSPGRRQVASRNLDSSVRRYGVCAERDLRHVAGL